MNRHYCCYFDHRYLARGLAMIRSLRTFDPHATFWVLCLSDRCETALQRMAEPNVRTIALADLERDDAALLAAKNNRTLVEYYFTCTPSLVRFVMRQVNPGEIVTYVDGDLYFFADPQPLFDELGDGAVSIIPHRFPPALQDRTRYGLYNVGWLSFRNCERGVQVAEWWRDRCNEWCHDRVEEDRFADQKYLDRFAELFEGVVVLRNPGANLAPWNIAGHHLDYSDDVLTVDGQTLIFFHFHGLRSLGRSWYFTVHAQYRAPLNALMRRRLYRPYLAQLSRIRAETEHLVEGDPPIVRGTGGMSVLARAKARLRQPKRFAVLFLRGQAMHVPPAANEDSPKSFVEALRKAIRKEQFAPGLLGPFVNPFFLARRALRREIACLAGKTSGARLLDVGCGRKPYRDLFDVRDYIGLEIDSPTARETSQADHFYDGKGFPFEEASFDIVLCNQVLEHVFNPEEFLAELRRVLRPGGKLLLTVPFVWDEHEQPWDYARYSSFGLAHLMRTHGFEPLDMRKTLADASIFGQLLNAYFFKIGWSKSKLGNAALLIFILAPTSLFWMAAGKVLPRNKDLYLDNILLAERKG